MNAKVSQKIATIPQARLSIPAEDSLLIALLNDIKRDASRMKQTGQEVAKRYGRS